METNWFFEMPWFVHVISVIALFYAIVIIRTLILEWKYKSWFDTDHGRFHEYDIIIDTGSAVRPKEPGILKNQRKEGWFIIYSDGFEWCVVEFNDIIKYKN